MWAWASAVCARFPWYPARARACGGSPCPHPLHPQPVGSGCQPRAPRTSGRLWVSAQLWTPHTKARDAARSRGALVPPPQQAKPACNSARLWVGDWSPHPHPPHREPVGSGPRPHAPRTGGRASGGVQPGTPRTQTRSAPPPGTLVPPHSTQSQYPRGRAGGLVAGPHAHSPRTHSQWVTAPGRTPQGRAVRRGTAPNPGRPTSRQGMPRAPSSRPHSGQSQRAKAGLPAGERATPSQARGQRDRATPRRAK